uniref:Uncharacterized protein n=1 Tax=Arundo donax TaxID=35708 RepID=A0A0A9HRC9_ARUDO
MYLIADGSWMDGWSCNLKMLISYLDGVNLLGDN